MKTGMITKMINTLPILGGVGGAWSQIELYFSGVTPEMIVATIVYAFIGSVIGYGVKMIFDYTRKRINDRRTR